MNLGANVKIGRAMTSKVAGTSNVNADVGCDMSGYDGVLFILAVGALTATQITALKAQQDTDVAYGTAQDLAGSKVGPLADGDSGKLLVLDIYRPVKRYVRAVVLRGTANAVIDGVIAIQYKGIKAPDVIDTTYVAARKILASPAEGTA